MIVLAAFALASCWLAAVHLGLTSSLPGTRMDTVWARRIAAQHTAPRDVLAQTLAILGGFPIGALLDLGLAAVVALLRGVPAGATVVVACAFSEGNVLLLKCLSLRPSPSGALYLGFLGSFPSGHTANTAVLAVSIGLLWGEPLIWAAGFASVVLMALDRTYLEAHWLTDTLAGAIVGSAAAIFAKYCVEPVLIHPRRGPLRATVHHGERRRPDWHEGDLTVPEPHGAR
ncbi:phosphatase PAP2 family protein [Amnibacterium sp. CER49]|uniref:phosphatase PAP2 family protein n=1 Tax=Amnibacterium sp. CER49 TaxID=3039161 RepID=UPI00244A2907|nr:phosphatase PAP2 family protein [Amnibacterium sp. CER49]MDH2443517.1 phosphatase PAP2 family protein [Amnibacterium sp. CER49]